MIVFAHIASDFRTTLKHVALHKIMACNARESLGNDCNHISMNTSWMLSRTHILLFVYTVLFLWISMNITVIGLNSSNSWCMVFRLFDFTQSCLRTHCNKDQHSCFLVLKPISLEWFFLSSWSVHLRNTLLHRPPCLGMRKWLWLTSVFCSRMMHDF